MKHTIILVSVVVLVLAASVLIMSFPSGETRESRPVAFPDTTRPESLAMFPVGNLTVKPGENMESTGDVGGPFTPASKTFTLTNSGGAALDWTVSNTQGWITLSPALSGTLGPGASATVAVSINSNANGLPPKTYTDTVTFTNRTTGNGNTARLVSLTVRGGLSVTSSNGFISTGVEGGPFDPPSIIYTVQNTDSAPIRWEPSKTQAWITLSPALGGPLAPGGSVPVTVSINSSANLLTPKDWTTPSTYTDTVTFTNTKDGRGNTTRPVSLTVNPPGILEVYWSGNFMSFGKAGGPFNPASFVCDLYNKGWAPINWQIYLVSTSFWLRGTKWLTFSQENGTIQPRSHTSVTISINSIANSFGPGEYSEDLIFRNMTNSRGQAVIKVSLGISQVGVLTVTPSDGLVSAGPAGGPFNPASIIYMLQNTGY